MGAQRRGTLSNKTFLPFSCCPALCDLELVRSKNANQLLSPTDSSSPSIFIYEALYYWRPDYLARVESVQLLQALTMADWSRCGRRRILEARHRVSEIRLFGEPYSKLAVCKSP